jgi:hypothetical protein
MAGTAHTAGSLYGVLNALTSGAQLPPDIRIDVGSLTGRSQVEIADIIVDALRPFDGTQDGEAARESVAVALSELLETDEGADLTALTPEQIDFVVESYLANDLAQRIELDVGLSILQKAGPVEGVKRLDEMKRFIRQEVGRCMRERAKKGETLTRRNAATLSSQLLKDVFEIFESYL